MGQSAIGGHVAPPSSKASTAKNVSTLLKMRYEVPKNFEISFIVIKSRTARIEGHTLLYIVPCVPEGVCLGTYVRSD